MNITELQVCNTIMGHFRYRRACIPLISCDLFVIFNHFWCDFAGHVKIIDSYVFSYDTLSFSFLAEYSTISIMFHWIQHSFNWCNCNSNIPPHECLKLMITIPPLQPYIPLVGSPDMKARNWWYCVSSWLQYLHTDKSQSVLLFM